MAVAALCISILAAVFAGVVAVLAFKEQRYRLRPHLYVDNISVNCTKTAMTTAVVVKNVGLVTAKNVTISPSISLGETTKSLDVDEEWPKSLVLPQQTITNTPTIQGKTWETRQQDILQGILALKLAIHLAYEGAGRRFFFTARYRWNHVTGRWAFEGGDAN